MQSLPLDFGPSPEAWKDSIPFKTTAPAASVVSPASRSDLLCRACREIELTAAANGVEADLGCLVIFRK